MKELFLTNYSSERFVDRLKSCFARCSSFALTVSFIKEAGMKLIEREMEEALARGAKGKLITSTYQNFTDIPSLRKFLDWQVRYPGFSCHLDDGCFSDNGYHSKGYLFEIGDEIEFLVGSTNITRFALLKNIEWNVSLIRGKSDSIVRKAREDFDSLYERTLQLTEERIRRYTIALDYAIERWDMDYDSHYDVRMVMPNSMQRKALKELQRYRAMGANKALIVAATASGKTYLAAFDARNFDAKRLLFIVHRDTILSDAQKTFQKVFLSRRSYGFFTGRESDLDADFLFATNTMMAAHLDYFSPDEFDYIVFDECHHVTATTYRKIWSYFQPRFLLGLTATPERMDNQDVFSMFDKNVPYELSLREAIRNDLVVPFKYYGIRDLAVDYSRNDVSRFLSDYYTPEHCAFLAREIEAHRPEGKLKAIAFCRTVKHCELMAHAMGEQGYGTTALSGMSGTGERIKAFEDLQDSSHPLEIIFTVDILNEGVDIPGVNMVLFLRPTDSSTIFNQQLGRGLRKAEGKNFLTVLDFIGNSYDRSVQIASALTELTNSPYPEKATLAEVIRSGGRPIDLPGVEIHIDELSKEEILRYIEQTNFNSMKLLEQDYRTFKKYLMKETFPSHLDYLHSETAPNLLRFLKAKTKNKVNRSYYNFLKAIDEDVPLFSE
ncbi:MAG: DEAD/DEAH box helicase family protein, partial [Candidatus Enteromonas sp.]